MTTASLLLMQGADLAAVRRIVRHQDPRITTEVYGHPAPGYLKNEINRLSFGPPPADLSGGGTPAGAATVARGPHGAAKPGRGERRFGAAATRRRAR